MGGEKIGINPGKAGYFALQSKVWLAMSNDNGMESLILTRSPYRNNVKKRIVALSQGYGALNWMIWKLSEEDAKFALEKFAVNVLYQTKGNNAVS